MNFMSLIGVELTKLRRSKIILILLAPVIMMWIPSIVNAEIHFDPQGRRGAGRLPPSPWEFRHKYNMRSIADPQGR